MNEQYKIYLSVFFATVMSLLLQGASAANIFGVSQPYGSFQNVLLPHDANIVNVIYQDKGGMVWLGTKRGLFSYNGYDAHRFNTLAIRAIAQADDKHLYLGADNGLLLFNLETEQFEDTPDAYRRLGYVRSLLYDDGTLWIGTRDRGLWQLSTKNQLAKCKSAWRDGTIFTMRKTAQGIYVGTKEGLCLIDRKGECLPCSSQSPLLRNIYAIHADGKAGDLLIGTGKGLVRYNPKSEQVTVVSAIQGFCVNSIAEDKDGYLLIGTERGLLVWDGRDALRHVTHSSHDASSLRNNVIWDIFCDRNDNVWLATDRGFSVTRPQTPFSSINLSQLSGSTSGNVLTSILRDHSGGYWLGGDNGLIHIAPGSTEVEWFSTANAMHPLHNNQIRSIYEDSDGEIWIATDASIAHYNKNKDNFDYFTLHDYRGRNANWSYAFYEDNQGRLWVSTYQGGLYVVDKQALLGSGGSYTMTRNLFGKDDAMVSTAYNMVGDDKGNVWLNFGDGMSVVNVRTLKAGRRNAWLDNMVYLNNAIWYSENGVLKRHDAASGKTTTTTFSNREGMIYTLVAEHDNLWFSTSNGIYCFDTKRGTVTNSYVTKEQYLTGFYDSESNELIWGAEDCLMRMNLHTLFASQNKSSSPIVTAITSSRDGSESLSPRFSYNLHLGNGHDVTLELSPLDYSNPDEINIYYQLNDEEWHVLGKGQNKILFAALPYGRSVLHVCNGNPELDPNIHVVSYTLEVEWPWFLSWWMWTIYVLLLCTATGLVVRLMQQRNKRKYQQREKEKSMELSRQKIDFFVNMSHELKTPLSLVIAPLGALAAETTNVKFKERLKPIQENALRLSNLINRILDFKRMEYESEDTLIRSHVEMCSLLNNCINAFAATQQERHISIRFTSNVEQLWINADAMKLESIFINLISNAVKYVSNNTGEVNVELRAQEEKFMVVIEDNGKGMAEDEIPMMAIRFFQGKNARKVGGTGIGFYLVKKFTELHGGTVNIANHNGLCVSIEIPIVGDNSITEQVEDNKQTEALDGSPKPTLLIVDDNREITEFLSEALSHTYTCQTAHNGKEGLELVKSAQPDLIIVDEMMPVMDGLEFSRQVRRLSLSSVVPIIMLTAKNDERTELDSIKAGVDVFMPKPFDMKKLSLQIVQLLLKRQRMEEAVNIQHISNPAFESPQAKTPSGDEAILEHVTAIIEENMADESFNVAMLSEMAHIDQKQLYRKLTQLTGLTTIAYIKKLRMKKAAMLLAEQRFTVSEVMYMVGYSNASYFTKCFVAEYGTTPKQYANEKRS